MPRTNSKTLSRTFLKTTLRKKWYNMLYLKRPSGHFDRCSILLQYIGRETFFLVRCDGSSIHTRTHTLSEIQRVTGICYAQYSTWISGRTSLLKRIFIVWGSINCSQFIDRLGGLGKFNFRDLSQVMKKHAQLWISYLLDNWSQVTQLVSFGQRFGIPHIFYETITSSLFKETTEFFAILQEVNTICAFENEIICIGFTSWELDLFKMIICYMHNADMNSPFSYL